MSRSRTGLPEAIGSTAHHRKYENDPPKYPDLCEIRDCHSLRVGLQPRPDGKMEGIYERGKAEIYLRDKRENFIGAVCQSCYSRILDSAGKDQLSQVRFPECQQFELIDRTPQHLKDHLVEIEDQLADQWAADHDAAD
jgi:hypothetical protein